MENLVKIGEVNADGSAELKLLRETLEKAGFLVAEYPKGRFEDYLVILEKKQNDMCPLCETIYSRDQLDNWLYDDSMPRNVIYKDIFNYYLYTKVSDNNCNEETRTLINYCPVCGKKLV